MQQAFNILLIVMAVLAVVVFIALFFVDAGYGMLLNRKWGKTVSNKVGWFVMESPVFLLMTVLWLMSDRRFEAAPLCFLFLFQLHYFQRAFIFPFLLKGRGRMPLAIIAMGILFNMVNAVMQGGWIFYLAPEGLYTSAWLKTPQFIVGTAVFIAGMVINIHSDHIIRNLRRPGDTAHHIPYGGMFRWVSSANYFGEFVEWVGFAVLTWSWSGRYSPCGRSPTSRPAPSPCVNVTRPSSATSSGGSAEKVSCLLYFDRFRRLRLSILTT